MEHEGALHRFLLFLSPTTQLLNGYREDKPFLLKTIWACASLKNNAMVLKKPQQKSKKALKRVHVRKVCFPPDSRPDSNTSLLLSVSVVP